MARFASVISSLALLLWAGVAGAQVSVVYPGAHRFGELVITAFTVATLPPAFNPNTIFIVTDGTATDDCTIGGGSDLVLCVWSGSAYAPLSGAAPGVGTGVPGGSAGQVQYNAGGGDFGGDAGMAYNAGTDTLTVGTVVGNLTGNVTGTTSGNAGTATALAANGANCSAGSSPLGVDASGAVESCFDVATQTELDTHVNATSGPHGAVSTNTASRIVARDASGNFAAGSITASLNGNAGTATALAANGTNCGAGEAAQGVDASGNAEGCFTPEGGGAGTPGGADTQVQFNSAGTFAGDTGMTFNSGTNVLTVTGGVVTNITGNATGNAGTATALAGNGANCSAGNSPLGVDASGAAEGCFAVIAQSALDDHVNATAVHGAASANTASRIVIRDASGNFSAGTISAALAGNASTATNLAANGSNCSAGSAPIGVDSAGNAESCFDVATQAELNTHTALTGTSAHGATTTNTASQLVSRDASGNFAAGTITATLSGNASTATAFVANPTDCSANQYANAIAASGNLSCAQVGFNELTGTTNTINATHIDETATYAWTGPNSFTKAAIPPVTITNLPASPTDGQLVIVTDGSSAGQCELNGGSSANLCRFNAAQNRWEPASSVPTGSLSLQAIADNGRTIANAVDATTAHKVGNGTIHWLEYCDSSNECVHTTDLPSDTIFKLFADKSMYVRDSNGTSILTIDEATAEITKAKGLVSGFSIPIARDGGLADTDDFNDIVRIPFGQTITQVCGKTDTGTSSVNIQRNDGSAANILSSNLTAATTEACTTTFVSGENILTEGHYINFVMVTAAASGTPTRVTLSVKTKRD